MAARRHKSDSGARKRVLIVDGHSMIFAMDDLNAMHLAHTATAREALVNMLTTYQDAGEYKVVVVYDGRGIRISQEKMPDGIQIFYSDSNRTADDVIERLVAKYSERYEITVATNDNMERQTVISFGAYCIDAQELERRIHAAEASIRREIKKRRRGNQQWRNGPQGL